MIVLIAVLVLADSGGRALRPDVRLRVALSAPGRPVPAGFLGLSFEYYSLEAYTGSDPAAINPVLLELIRNLTPGQAPVIRLGGDSTDRVWWPIAGVPTPPWVKFALGPQWVAVARSLSASLHARLILGINLEAASPAIASAEQQALLRGLGSSSIRAFEIGNEPELYGIFAWYRSAGGQRVTGRPHDYDYNAYSGDFATIAPAVPNEPLAGPAFGNFSWTQHLGEFIGSEPRVGLATLHRYPLQHCFVKPSSPRYPSIANLLAPSSSTGLANSFAAYAATAHAHNVPLRLDELNTVSCGAVPAVSKSFASALWAPDALFELIRAGVDGVNFHTFPRGGYELFRFSDRGGRWQGLIYPEYYGMLLFAEAAPAGSRLVPVLGAAPAPLKTWATLASDGTVRVLVINKDPRRGHVVAIGVRSAGARASLLRLQAPSVAARSGVTLGGAGFGASTTSGRLSPHLGHVDAGGGSYTVSVPAGSAALLTVATRS